MNKKIKTLLLALAGILVLVGILVALMLTKPQEEEADDTPSTVESTKVALIEEDLEDLESVTIENESGTVHVLPETTTETGSDGEENEVTRYIVQEVKDYDQSSTGARQLVNTLVALTADSKVEDTVEDLAKYGLDAPLATAEVVCADATYHITIGMHNEGAKEYYMMLEGDEALYSLSESNAGRILNSVFFYVDLTLSDSPNASTGELPQIDRFLLSRPDLEEDIVLEPYTAKEGETRIYSSGYVMTSPIHSELNYYVDDEMLPKMFGLSANSVVDYYDEAKAADYGLDEPAAVLDFQYEGKPLKLVVGGVVPAEELEEGADTCRYLLVNDNGLLYTIAEDDIPFLTATADDLITTLPILPNIVTVSSMDVELDGKTYTFEILNEQEDEEDDTLTTTGVTYQGEELDLDIFKKYYQLAISSTVENINLEENSEAPVLEITFHYTEGGEEVLTFYPLEDSRRMQVAVNGELIYEGRIAYIEKVRTETKHLLDGEKVDIDW